MVYYCKSSKYSIELTRGLVPLDLEEIIMKITKDTIIGDVLTIDVELAPFFFEFLERKCPYLFIQP